MGNGIQIGHRPTQAEMTAAKYDRDFYVVFLEDNSGPMIPQTSWTSANLDQLIDDILSGEMFMPESIDQIVRFNPVTKASSLVEREVANAVSERTHETCTTPNDFVIDWLEQWRCDFYASDEYLNKCTQEHVEGLADYRRDLRMMAAE
ncbi:hypothetical protein ACFONL_00145 [Camelimonas fluminis]|uniref:Uncharacterized protein n=2 Tax=Camelimonas fluminis TaxID=1576911 RepID=A0ABV7UB30_9HYPH